MIQTWRLAGPTILYVREKQAWLTVQGTPSPSAGAELVCHLAEEVPLQSIREITCTFGGGFSPVRVQLHTLVSAAETSTSHAVSVLDVYPKDGNMAQTFA